MTELVQRVIAEIEKLPEEEQNAIARRILAELADERAWSRKFAGSQDALAKLAREAPAEDDAGLAKGSVTAD